MNKLIQGIKLKRLFPDQDYLLVEIRQGLTRVPSLITFTFLNHRGGNNLYCGSVTLEKVYAAQLEIALGQVDPSLNIKLDGSCLK